MDGDDHDAEENEDRYIELDYDGAPHKVTAPCSPLLLTTPLL
jgi:hypothetical protein